MATGITSQFLPSREVYKDYSAEANIYNNTLGDTPLSPLANIAQGISSGIDLGNKANAFIRDNSAEGAERRRLDLEIKRSQAAIQSQNASMNAIKAKHASILQELQLKKETADLQRETIKGQIGLENFDLMNEAYAGIGQIKDAGSLADFLSNPQYRRLRNDPDFNNLVRSHATELLSTATPQEQVRLIQTIEAMSPGSGAKIEELLPTETQLITADPNRGVRGNAQTAAQARAKENQALFKQQVLDKHQREVPKDYEPVGLEVNSGTGDDAGQDAGTFMVYKHPVTKDVKRYDISKYKYGTAAQQAAQEAIIYETFSQMDTMSKQYAADKKTKTGLAADVPGVAARDPNKNTVNTKASVQLSAGEKTTKAQLGIDVENEVADPYVKQIDAIVSTSAGVKDGYGNAEKRAVEKIADDLIAKEGLTGEAAKNRKAGIMEGAVKRYRAILKRKQFGANLSSKVNVTGISSKFNLPQQPVQTDVQDRPTQGIRSTVSTVPRG